MNAKKQKQPKTHMERMGFSDKDLYTKAHDAICQWLQNQKALLSTQMVFPKDSGCIVEEIMPEVPLHSQSNRTFVVGFVDLKVTFSQPYFDVIISDDVMDVLALDKSGLLGLFEQNNYSKHELVALHNNWKRCSASLALDNSASFYAATEALEVIASLPSHLSKWIHRGESTKTVVYEVKSSISSVGAVLRELNFYKQFFQKDTTFALVTPPPPNMKGLDESLKLIGVHHVLCPEELVDSLENKHATPSLEERVSALEKQLGELKTKKRQTTLF